MSDTRLKICLRGLPANTELRSIQKELRERGLDPVFMRHVAARDNSPGVFCVQLQVTPAIVEVYDIKKMLGVPIRVEAWRGRQGPPQCQRCQGFRHSAAECLREYRCVHCARPHPSRQCNRPYDIPTCANCRGPHAANDFSCPAMRREQIAKAGKVLRTTGYTLATPKPVEEANAPSSLMAEANAKWTEIKRRRRKNRTSGKSEASSTSPDRELEIQEAQQYIGALSLVQESQSTQNAVSELKKEGSIHESKALASSAVKSKPATRDIKPVHVSPVKESLINKSQCTTQTRPKPALNGSISKEKPQTVSAQQRSLTSPVNKSVPAKKESHQASVELIKEAQPIENTAHQVSYVPVVNEPAKMDTMNPEAIRAKVAYECILILQNVLGAIQQGNNPVPIILESLAKLYQGA